MSGPTYTYTANTPNSSDPMNTTQSLILNNFQAINELIGVNHVGFNTVDDFGKHNFISMPNQSSIPGTTTTEVAMFTQATGTPNPCEIFVQSANNGSLTQISNTSTPSGQPVIPDGTAGTGWCKFNSGLIMKWGIGTVTIPANTGNLGVYYQFPTGSGIPTFSQGPYFGQMSLTSNSSNNDYGGIAAYIYYGAWGTGSRQQFQITGIYGPTTITFNWLAIGF